MNRMKRGSWAGVLLVLVGMVGLAPAAWANTWSSAVDGYWNDGSKWSDGVPPAAGTAAVLNVVGSSYAVTYTNPVVATMGAVTIANTTGYATTLNINSNGINCGAMSMAFGAININTGGALICAALASTQPSTLTMNGGSFWSWSGAFGNSIAGSSITVNMSSGGFTNTSGNNYMFLNMTGGTVAIGGNVYDTPFTSTVSGGVYTNYSSQYFNPRSSTFTIKDQARFYSKNIQMSAGSEKIQVYGGTATITGPNFWIGFDSLASGARVASFIQTNGVVSMASTNGLVIGYSVKGALSAGSTNLYQLAGGDLFLEKITLAANAYTGGYFNVYAMSGGVLNLGSGGIVYGGGNGTQLIELSGGTVGAQTNWSSSLGMTLANAVVFRASDTNNVARDISLSGTLSGNGGFIKTGGGALQLAGTHTFSGASSVSNGILRVTGVKAGTGALTIAGGMLAGAGTLAGTVTNGAIISANETTTVGTMTITNLVMAENSSYIWNYGDAGNDLIDVKGFLTLPNVATVTVSRASGSVNALPASATLFSAPAINNPSAVSGWVVTGALPTTRVKVVDNQVQLVTPTGWVMSVQ